MNTDGSPNSRPANAVTLSYSAVNIAAEWTMAIPSPPPPAALRTTG
jgi:hypothetical protein